MDLNKDEKEKSKAIEDTKENKIEGTKLDELYERLDKIDSSLASVSVIGSKQHIDIRTVKKNGKLTDFVIKEDMDGYEKIIWKGSDYRRFKSVLESFYSKTEITRDYYSIIFHSDSDVEKENGDFKSRWYVINTDLDWFTPENAASFPKIELSHFKDEYKILMETKMAFRNEWTGEIYPITASATQSIGRLLDAGICFKDIPDVPMAHALMLAQKFNKMNKIEFYYNKNMGSIKPLYFICGSRYKRINLNDIFKSVMIKADRLGSNRTGRWTVDSDSTATLYVEYDESDIINQNKFKWFRRVIRITASIKPGISTSVSALAKFGGGYMLLKSNKQKHDDSMDPNALFDGIEEAFHEFEELMTKNEKRKSSISNKDIERISSIIGKGNTKRNIYFNEVHKDKIPYLIKEMVERTYVALPEKQHEELIKEYNRIAQKLLLK